MKRRGISSAAIVLFVFLQSFCNALSIHDCPASSCGNIPNISYPFRLSGDPPHCGNKRYELVCQKNNATILALLSGKYHVHEIDYKRRKIRVSDAGVTEDTSCSFIPRYFLGSTNLTDDTAHIINPLSLAPFDDRGIAAYFNCSNPITNDPRYVKVDTTRCGSGGHIYAVLKKDSSSDFRVMDIKIGCQLKVATFANWATKKDHNNKKNDSYDDIHNMLAYGFWLSWLHVLCDEQCAKWMICRPINDSSIECDRPSCFSLLALGSKRVTYGCVIGKENSSHVKPLSLV
ncbi:uncharacterized protein LOC133285932 [Gastrolobium bilobum]|uniref:uncharacterized protein LOC133285932 n=1 Tax=Gastrolobium bilobum TaxID=150636 RepID=UPI002AB0F295|nr:uncharacterized protein LOC133285932 [Gastrolobium bilobum]